VNSSLLRWAHKTVSCILSSDEPIAAPMSSSEVQEAHRSCEQLGGYLYTEARECWLLVLCATSPGRVSCCSLLPMTVEPALTMAF